MITTDFLKPLRKIKKEKRKKEEKPYSRPKNTLHIPSTLFFIQMNSACLTQAQMIASFPHGLVT